VWVQEGLENKLWDYVAQRLPQAEEVPVQVPELPFQPIKLAP